MQHIQQLEFDDNMKTHTHAHTLTHTHLKTKMHEHMNMYTLSLSLSHTHTHTQTVQHVQQLELDDDFRLSTDWLRAQGKGASTELFRV